MKLGKPTKGLMSVSGFSLIEVVIAMSVIGVTFIALYAALTSCLVSVQASREDLRATQIMVEQMDTLRLFNWDQVTDPTFSPKTLSVYYDPAGATNGTGGTLYECVMTVTNGPADVAYSDDMRTVGLEITWITHGSLPNPKANAHAAKGQLHTRTFTTSVTKNGLQAYVY
jgi:prepilin-type N-terminal cleavage/methylation domain-containing protein